MRSNVSATGANSPRRCVSGQKPDEERRDRHRGDGESQRGAAAEAIADMADQCAPDRAHQITDREHPERRKQLGDRVFLPEELPADLDGEIAVDRKIVPFEHVADHARRNHLALLP
jgi:hypothetical protein